MVTAPGPNDHGSVTARKGDGEVTAQSRPGHSSVTARSQLSHGQVTAQSQHLQYDHGSVTARSQLNHGPGHGWLWPFWSRWAHGEQSRWPIFFSWESKVLIILGNYGGFFYIVLFSVLSIFNFLLGETQLHYLNLLTLVIIISMSKK